MNASRKWAEDYIAIQQRQPTSYLKAKNGRVVLTLEQLGDTVAWIHHCALFPGE